MVWEWPQLYIRKKTIKAVQRGRKVTVPRRRGRGGPSGNIRSKYIKEGGDRGNACGCRELPGGKKST